MIQLENMDLNNRDVMIEYINGSYKNVLVKGNIIGLSNWKIIDCGYVGHSTKEIDKKGENYFFIIKNIKTNDVITNIPFAKCNLTGIKNESKNTFAVASFHMKQLYYKLLDDIHIDFQKDVTPMMIWMLYYSGCFKPSKFNKNNPADDRDFLLKALKQDTLTPFQQKKLKGLLYYDIKRHLLSRYRYVD